MNRPTAWEHWKLASFDSDTVVEIDDAAVRAVATPEETPPPPDPIGVAPPPDPIEIERICAQAREDAYQAAYQAGLQMGRDEGYAVGQAVVKEEAARIQKVANELDRALQELDQQVADELLALAVEIARQVVRHEIAVRPSTILGVINEALTHLPHQHATIYLNPEDASLVRSHQGDVLAHAGHRILEEPTLKRGDCLLEAGGSQVDASMATRWRRVVESLGSNAPWDQ